MASAEEVYQALADAASQEPARVRAAHTRLQELQRQPGTYAEMQNIAATRSVPLNIRQMGIIQFKNNGTIHWRSRAVYTDIHKADIRTRAMSFLDEADDTIAQCNAIIVSKIARIDYPKQWPTLISDLMSVIQSSTEARFASPASDPRIPLTLKRALKVLDQVLKELSSVKVLVGAQNMTQVTKQLHGFLINVYGRFSAQFQGSVQPATINSPENADDIEIAHLAFKCLSKIMIWLWGRSNGRSDDDDAIIASFFENSSNQIQALWELRVNLILSLRSGGANADATGLKCIDFFTRHIRLFGKVFRRMQQLSLFRFGLLPQCSNLTLFYWSKIVEATGGPAEYVADEQTAVYPTKFLLQGMVLFKNSLSQWSPTRKARNGSMDTDHEEVFSVGFVEQCVQLLVSRFIPLNGGDLEKWMEDPEEWVNDEEKETDAWEFELRPCAERVLMTMAVRYPEYVTPLLKQTFDQVTAIPSTDLPSVLQREALYCAIGRCAYKMKDVIDFDQWLSTHLVNEVQQSDPNYRILKRRIAWVIGKWISEECAPANSPKVWEVLLYLLQDTSDVVVRLSAAVALRECVDTTSFSEESFEPFLAGNIAGLVQLLGEVETLDNKNRVTKCLNNTIERVGIRIVPYMNIIAGPIPQLWESAENDYIFKASLLGTAQGLVTASREHSAALHPLVIPLVQESLNSDARLHLDQDGLGLWLAALRNATTLDPLTPGTLGLIDLLPGAMALLAENLDLLGTILNVIQSYLLLDATKTLQAQGLPLHQACKQCMSQALSANVKDLLINLNLMVQVAPSSLWAEAMHVSGLFWDLLKAVIDDKRSSNILTEHIYIFARMVLQDPLVFCQLISATASAQGIPETELYDKLLDQWWRKFDVMAEPRHRKLAAMGLGSLVATGRPEVLKRLSGEILNVWLDVLGEMKEALESDDDDGHLHLYWKHGAEAEPHEAFLRDKEGTLEEERCKAVFTADPVQSQKLTMFLAWKLREAPAACPGGPEVFQREYLGKTDPLALQQLEKALAT
ncbi:hypothetical protein BOTBODRAFT_309717 [Botryobasidium botryosum FD-172 SS1]|uniref:Importin N-terminal domain-containing protein n=1 Tax=Botryobasidium botryosum (strain FD-172 SS1) TaxID=930990 RepID=A0A067N9P5_BOTB1|nr:hypothetical protein BOTBODRAFT_309717 [Botryobasidium botryosum FD-172 SS1]